MKALNADKLGKFLKEEDFRKAYKKLVEHEFDNGDGAQSGKFRIQKLDWEKLKKEKAGQDENVSL